MYLGQPHRERLLVRAGLILPGHDDLDALGRLCQGQDREREPTPWPQRGRGLLVRAVEPRPLQVRADEVRPLQMHVIEVGGSRVRAERVR